MLLFKLIFLFQILYCGTERSAVKHLSDPAATLVNLTPVSITIDSLLSLPYSNHEILFHGNNLFRLPDEYRTYIIKVYPKCWSLENDNDYHLVCCDSFYKRTFIAEIPDPNCTESIRSGHSEEFRSCRRQIDSIQFVTFRGRNFFRFRFYLLITGVLFHDKIHKSLGQSKNGIELHPVLSIGY